MTGVMPRASAAARLAWLSYPLSVIAMRGRMFGPMSSDVSNWVLSLASPPVRWKSRGLPSRSVLRWILVRSRRASGRTLGAAAPFCPGRRDVGACGRAVEELDQMCRLAAFRQRLEECLEYPERLSRQNRFQTLFHLPYSMGNARHVMLCTVK